MPNVLEYSTPRNERRHRFQGDWLFAILALLQACIWISPAFPGRDAPSPDDFQWSLFAIAWHISHYSFGPSLIECLLTTAVFIATLLPPNRRLSVYLAYVISVPVSMALSLISLWYLEFKLPGAWRTLLGPHYSGFDPLTSVDELVRLCDPIFWILLLRLAIPNERFVGRKLFEDRA